MATVKLTLSADEKVVRKARQMARKNKTSISAMFSRMVMAVSIRGEMTPQNELGPLTRKALGIVKLPPNVSDKQLIEESLMKKYGFKK